MLYCGSKEILKGLRVLFSISVILHKHPPSYKFESNITFSNTLYWPNSTLPQLASHNYPPITTSLYHYPPATTLRPIPSHHYTLPPQLRHHGTTLPPIPSHHYLPTATPPPWHYPPTNTIAKLPSHRNSTTTTLPTLPPCHYLHASAKSSPLNNNNCGMPQWTLDYILLFYIRI